MLTENCLNANAFGCRYFTERPASVPCDGACASAPELTDRRGEHFPVLRAWGCRSEIENGKILYLADKSKDWQSARPALCAASASRPRAPLRTASACCARIRARRSKRRRISPVGSSIAAQNEFQIVIFYLDYTFYYQIVRQYHGNRFGISIPAPSGAARRASAWRTLRPSRSTLTRAIRKVFLPRTRCATLQRRNVTLPPPSARPTISSSRRTRWSFWAMTASANRATRRTRCACCARLPAALTRSARA